MTIRSEIQIENICSLEFGDIRGGVTLRRLILRSFECTCVYLGQVTKNKHIYLKALMSMHVYSLLE